MTETTETKQEEAQEIHGTRSPLARVVPIEESRIDLFNPKRWTQEDIDTIKKTVCPAGIPDADFKLFIMKCQASGMNPLLGEAFCIKRNQNVGTKASPRWIEVFQFTPGEQGMEGRADDFHDYRGLRAAAVYENDKIVIDASSGEVSHQFNPVDPKRGRLIGAWAIAYRDGRKTPVEFVRLEEYFDDRNGKWTSSPATMIVKCARAAALRRAYPNAFDGVFVREELRDDVAESQTPVEKEQANKATTDVLADRMKATAAAQAGLKEAKPPSAKGATVDVVASKAPDTIIGFVELKADLKRFEIIYDAQRLEKDDAYAAEKQGEVNARKAAKAAPKTGPTPSQLWTTAGGDNEKYRALMTEHGYAVAEPLPHQVADAKKAETAAQGPTMSFGPKKNQPISSLSGPELLEMTALGEGKIGSLEPAKAAKVRACLDALRAEEARRQAALLADPPEPGADLDVD